MQLACCSPPAQVVPTTLTRTVPEEHWISWEVSGQCCVHIMLGTTMPCRPAHEHGLLVVLFSDCRSTRVNSRLSKWSTALTKS
jgi:hypothetical protein